MAQRRHLVSYANQDQTLEHSLGYHPTRKANLSSALTTARGKRTVLLHRTRESNSCLRTTRSYRRETRRRVRDSCRLPSSPCPQGGHPTCPKYDVALPKTQGRPSSVGSSQARSKAARKCHSISTTGAAKDSVNSLINQMKTPTPTMLRATSNRS